MKKIQSITVEAMPDYDTDLSYLGKFENKAGEFAIEHNGGYNSYPYFNADNVENMKQAKQNYNRIMKYDSGELMDYGIRATAEIRTSDDGKTWLINTVKSGGVWGYSSDGGKSEFEAEAEQQVYELEELLKEFGFTGKEIKAVKVEYNDELKSILSRVK